MKLVIAPNAFKNSLPATAAVEALKEGLLQSGLKGELVCCPVGDGGDGTGELLRQFFKAEVLLHKVKDPLGRMIEAPLGWIPETGTAIIEMADAAGLRLLQPEEYAPLYATTAGCGQLIKKALDKGAAEILLCIGGSATVDGGTGILSELGIVFKDKAGRRLQRLPADLPQLYGIEQQELDLRVLQTNIVILCDVQNRLLGTDGAAAVFGPQKGATTGDVLLLEKALQRFNRVTEQTTGVTMNDLDHSGAAGGVAAALCAFCRAKPVEGIAYFLEKINFKQQLVRADWVVTGEGIIDGQTLKGKAPFGVAKMAKEQGCKVIGVAGRVPASSDNVLGNYFDRLLSINEIAVPLEVAIRNTRINLIRAGIKIGKWLRAEAGDRKE
ncbi:glycerate kinase [Niabella ginsenosidivorans]|uniref:Glycerate kinase n=1 Tax=Niabella ginsenosidivorans TaxID=1176587 RepID=A0A1A9I7I1_9BACT|nr:glycerate kinase [Niabella ginsenosidivorans]ANH83543.1 glycerate kinase [Niabella ginsenosidivorans]